MRKYILASGSPRRRELLKKIGIEFSIEIPQEERSIINKAFKYEMVEANAKEKGISVLKRVKEPSIIISADTVVVYKEIILGKPKNFDDAIHTLKLLNGETHKVITSVCIIESETKESKVRSETSEVTFKKCSAEKLKEYIYKYKPYDKAGAYGIQELDETYIQEIRGDYDNIVGLPIELLKRMLKEITEEKI